MKYSFIVLILFNLINIQSPYCQVNSAFEVYYDVNRVYKPLAISKDTLKVARTIKDLNRHFKPNWVKEYISVAIKTTNHNKIQTAFALDDTLTEEQIENINSTDPGTSIDVDIRYIPDNTLSHNEEKQFDFSLPVDPIHEAKYPGGPSSLKMFLQQNVEAHIDQGKLREYHLSAVQFTVDTSGNVVDVEVVESSDHADIDEVLLTAVCKMPNWQPASFATGQKVKQHFMLTVGDRQSCIINLLNIRRS